MPSNQTVMKVNKETHEKIKAIGKLHQPKLSPPKVVDLAVSILIKSMQTPEVK